MFENRRQPLISRRRFALRVVRSLLVAACVDGLAVGIGAVAYHRLEGIGWLLSTMNAAMVITGNGMVSQLHTSGGRLFAIFDALFGVLAFISVAGVILAPVFHRLMHTFHLEPSGKEKK